MGNDTHITVGWTAAYSVEEIRVLAAKYPWFDAAQRASAKDPLPAHILLTKAFRPFNPGAEAITAAVPHEHTTLDIIDSFIAKGDHKVVADDNTPDYIAGAANDDFVPDDEIVSEELAEIFMKQGLLEQAASIFDRLSLLYPEKSVYFAELMETARKGGVPSDENV